VSDGDSVQVYTIGHSNVPSADVVELLRTHGIRTLVDVRSVPYGQYTPQFSREAFAEELRRADIEYRFAGEHLGGRPKDPTCYKDGRVPDGHADYLQLVDYEEVARRPWFRKGLEHLARLAGEQPTAIMCSEEDPSRCHRHRLIAVNLLAVGVRVRHIRHTRDSHFLEDAMTIVEREAAEARKPQQLTLGI